MTVTARVGPLWVRALGGGALLLVVALMIPILAGGNSMPPNKAFVALGMELISGILGLILVVYGAWLVASRRRDKD